MLLKICPQMCRAVAGLGSPLTQGTRNPHICSAAVPRPEGWRCVVTKISTWVHFLLPSHSEHKQYIPRNHGHAQPHLFRYIISFTPTLPASSYSPYMPTYSQTPSQQRFLIQSEHSARLGIARWRSRAALDNVLLLLDLS